MRRSALRRPESLTDKYRILGKIGEGTYGMVFKAEAYSSALLPRPSSGGSGAAEDEEPMTFAIKLVKSHKEGKNDVVLSSATVREIKLLRELHHDNVVHLHDVHVDARDKSLALVFEYGDHDLHDIIVQSKQKPLGEYTRKSLMFQILKGVDYMHDAWVMHRDMKPQNILVVGHGRKRGQVKLADLGLARVYKEPIKALSDVERVVVTLWYRAPELLLGAKHYTKAVDLWAVGCIFAELINTRELFCGKEVEGSNAPFQKDQLDKIFKVLGMPTPQTWEGLDNLPEYSHVVQMGRERKYPTQSELKNAVKVGPGRAGAALLDLLSRLMEYDPETRITAKEALEHEYFKEIEPEPRDWAFDEPGKEPVSFRTQTVEPVAEETLPWKSKKDGAPGADGKPADVGAGSPHRDGSSSRHNDHRGRDAPSRSRSHHNSREAQQQPQRRSDRGNAGDATARDTRSRGPPAGGNAQAAEGSAWRDRSTGRTGGAAAPNAGAVTGAKRPGGGERPTSASTSNRPRSPKQPRRR
ncbi:Cyclin-dependent kinase [Phytophthora fragariae]|uniref:Cyclin-dependent kinase 2 homolog n=1 Tax=Phytophthora fragariae TaxID=53985 RepID=A0A6A3EUS7_9STRA|nr:Cyclin-dependent kinase [Phytophthora fragariae]KAE8993417.1 Cyclin-dependent kinase [Phytophthora fragariae]KAE9098203.1 Cyclin-dependent kinase [Phytophthora fragariae]KAE9111144.1 Cyclin-dependent kinase [Phytophthora fragariae]KAE9123325.1 Cyclin-dependent kinase [Phytophthora fragariae]